MASLVAEEPPREEEPEKVHVGKTAPYEFYDTQVLSFPMRARKPSTDEQFSRFAEIIQQVNINVPLMDAMKVPTYALWRNHPKLLGPGALIFVAKKL